jgi:hypothetical protein
MNKKKTYLWLKRHQQHLLGPFLCSSSYGIVSITGPLFLSHACHPGNVVVVLLTLLSSCGGCPRCWSSSPDPCCCCCWGCLALNCWCWCRSVMLFLLSWLLFFLVVVPSSSLSCQLLVTVGSSLPHGLVVNEMDQS